MRVFVAFILFSFAFPIMSTHAESVKIQKHSQHYAVKKKKASVPFVFYYYDKEYEGLAVEPEFNRNVFRIFDKGRNQSLSGGEYYDNHMVMYESKEFENRSFQDVDVDTVVPMSYDEYLERIKSLENYESVNLDGDEGLSPYDLAKKVGYKKTDDDRNNQVSFEEMLEAVAGEGKRAVEHEGYRQ